MTLPLPPITGPDGRLDPVAVQFAIDKLAQAFPLGLANLQNVVREGILNTSTADSPFRLIRGIVTTNGAGTINEGAGFTITRNGVGDVTVSFTSAFSDIPACVSTNVNLTASGAVYLRAAPSVSAARFQVVDYAGAAADDPFHFIAVGPS